MAIQGHTGIKPVPPYIALVDAYRRHIGAINVGTGIVASRDLNVFLSAAGDIIDSQPAGASGWVIGSTTTANYDGYCWIWRRIQWADGSTGWVQDNFIAADPNQTTPAPPYSLFQYTPQGDPIGIGTLTTADAVQFRGRVSSPSGNLVRLEVEVRTTSEAFTGVAQAASNLVASGSEASVCVSGLSNSPFHWQARTIDEDGVASPWVSFGGQSETFADFIVQANQCAICSTTGAALVERSIALGEKCGSGLRVTLSANPGSGSAPLNDVDLTATVVGSGSQSITYTHYCSRADAGTDITPGYASRVTTTATTRTAFDICDYPSPGTYVAKVIAEVGNFAAESRTSVTVGQAAPPTVSTLAATNITQTSATLNLSVNPNGSLTIVWFRWGTSSSSLTQTTPALDVGSGSSVLFRSSTISPPLACNTQYFFQAWADGSGPAISGSTLPFTTSSCGGSGGEVTEDLIDNGDFQDDGDFWVRSGSFFADDRFENHHLNRGYAYLSQSNGLPGNNLIGTIYQQVTIPPNASSATLRYWVSISTSEPSGSPAEDFLNATLQSGNGQFLGGLEILSNQSFTGGYFQRQFNLANYIGQTIRIHFLGTTNAFDPTVFRIDTVSLEVKVPNAQAPAVTTEAADQIGQTSARLNMTVNPNGATTSVWFDLEANDSTPTADTPHFSVGQDTQVETASDTISGLQCGTQYYFRANASNTAGSDQGVVRNFTTDQCSGGGSKPAVETLAADSITKTSVRLNGRVNPNGLSTEAWFAYGVTPSFGATIGRSGVGSGTSFASFSRPLSGLQCGKTYYFRIEAENNSGSANGDILTFATLPCDPGGALPGNFLAWAERQSCHGTKPAILFRWFPSKDASSIYTVKDTSGAYLKTADTSVEGFAHLAIDGLQYNQGYDFYVIAQNGAGTTPSNLMRVNIVNEECRGAGDPEDPPGPFILWREPFFCQNGEVAVELHWSAAAGAATYSLERVTASGGVGRNIQGLTTRSYLDSVDITPGILHAWILRAHNQAGATLAQFLVQVYPPTGLCGESVVPGQFTVSAAAPICVENEPAIPLSWTVSSSADKFYSYHVYGEGNSFGGGKVNTNILGFNYNAAAGVRADQVHELVMVSVDPQDESKKRFADSVYVYVPADVCGAPALAPEVYTRPANGITSTTAILRSQVRPNGTPTYVWFEWGTTTAYGKKTSEVDIGTTTLYLERPSRQVTGLLCETEHHFRVVALNATGMSLGLDESFLTEECGPCGLPELILANMSVSSTESYQACNVITVGPNVSVDPGGDLQLTAPRVVFGDGFSVKPAGSLQAGPPPI